MRNQKPKSEILGFISESKRILPGFKSQWIIRSPYCLCSAGQQLPEQHNCFIGHSPVDGFPSYRACKCMTIEHLTNSFTWCLEHQHKWLRSSSLQRNFPKMWSTLRQCKIFQTSNQSTKSDCQHKHRSAAQTVRWNLPSHRTNNKRSKHTHVPHCLQIWLDEIYLSHPHRVIEWWQCMLTPDPWTLVIFTENLRFVRSVVVPECDINL